MAADAAALLDQLMGSQRDAVPGDNVRHLKWWDQEVCKFYLCGFCPSELFTNTKSDVGPCNKVHDDKLKKDYEESDRHGKTGYEEEFLDHLEKIVRDLDRKINRGKERLRKSAEAKEKVMHGDDGTNEKLRGLNMEINALVMELEQLGAMGRVEEAQSLMRRVEDLERERERERTIMSTSEPKTLAGFEVDAHDFHEKMELCDVCGSFLVIGDTQSRVDAHLLGKQHIGYARIRAAITELRKHRQELWKQRMAEKREKGRARGRSRSRERGRRHSRRSRSRSRERYRRHSHRSRSRSHSRSRDQNRDRRERRRSRSRSKDREKERPRKSRSMERSKRERSSERLKERSPAKAKSGAEAKEEGEVD